MKYLKIGRKNVAFTNSQRSQLSQLVLNHSAWRPELVLPAAGDAWSKDIFTNEFSCMGFTGWAQCSKLQESTRITSLLAHLCFYSRKKNIKGDGACFTSPKIQSRSRKSCSRPICAPVTRQQLPSDFQVWQNDASLLIAEAPEKRQDMTSHSAPLTDELIMPLTAFFQDCSRDN